MTAAHLLPNGLYDLLPSEAAEKRRLTNLALDLFGARGFLEVCPPLAEFEDTLLAGKGKTMAKDTFRIMDPVSQKIMGLRADFTMQVARIAATRLSGQPLPLKLCYAGDVLRVKGSPLRGERQHTQGGLEIIGTASPNADVEVILLTLEALEAAGMPTLSVDLNLPTLARALVKESGVPPRERAGLLQALSRKDSASIHALNAANAPTLLALIGAVGPLPSALDRLKAIRLTGTAAETLAHFTKVTELLLAAKRPVQWMLDATEHRGFEYHTGLAFTVFAEGSPEELARGGRYDMANAQGESLAATGATMYLNAILRVKERL